MTPTTFGQLFQPYTFTLKAFALKLTRDKVDADDLYQDTLCKAIRYQHQYQPKTNLQAWLMTIMRNTFINEWRRRRRYLQIQQHGVPGVTLAASGIEKNNGEQSLVMQELTQAIDLLEEGQRQPFLLAYQGYKYEEIAVEMNLPVGTIKSRIHQARKALKKKLKSWYNGHSLQEILD